jgi:thiol:disulfide interchange protein DsbD
VKGRAIPPWGTSPDPGAKPESRSGRVAALLLAAAVALTGSARGLETPPIPDEIVALRVESANYSASQGALEVVLAADIADGWHINSHRPKSSSLVPTTLSVTAPTGFEVGDIEYPAGEERAFRFAAGQTLDVYGARVRFRIPVTVRAALTQSGASFEAKLHYQACDDTRCLRPADATRTFLVKRPLDRAAAAPAISGNAAPVAEWLTRYGLGWTLVLVFVMGLALNLTPCVYPLISVTIAYFGSQAQERRSRAFWLAGAYALGIALTFSMLGVGAALSGGLFGGALRQPITLVFLAGVMVALALSSFGLYALQPPPWILRKAGAAAGGMIGALFMGLTMGVVAAPCVGPIVVGLLLVVGAKADVALGFLLFFVLALGLGAPYVALGAAAGSITRLPRSGEWLVWMERVFGFLLLGVALYFVSPLLSGRALAWSVAALLAGAALTLGFYDTRAETARGFAFFKRALGSLALVAAAWIVLRPSVPVTDPIAWREFSSRALAQARSEGRPAVVDFRADWCLPCLEMDKTTFVSPAVTMRAEAFTMLRADVTDASKETESLLSTYGVLGVPTTLFFSSDGAEHHRMVGYVSAAEFARMLDDTRGAAAASQEREPSES